MFTCKIISKWHWVLKIKSSVKCYLTILWTIIKNIILIINVYEHFQIILNCAFNFKILHHNLKNTGREKTIYFNKLFLVRNLFIKVVHNIVEYYWDIKFWFDY